MEQIDDQKAWEFSYYIREITEKPLTIAFIAKDEDEAVDKWEEWLRGLHFKVESDNKPTLIK